MKFVDVFELQFGETTKEYHKEFMQCHFNTLKDQFMKKDAALAKKYHKLHILNPKIEEKVREEIRAKL